MDVQSIDTAYDQLQSQAQTTVQELKTLAGKLQTASQAGNPDAREWLLDLREIALAIQAEQNQVSNLLQALHGFVENQARAVQTLPASVPQSLPQTLPQASWQQQPQQPVYPPQGYPQPAYPQGYQGGYPQQGGGVLGGLFNSGFGRAILTGAGFGIGDDLINKIF
jgi:ABC-type transporter Mla subunit MlaD